MPVGIKAFGIGVVGFGSAIALTFRDLPGGPEPTLWPVSVGGWVGMATGLIALVGVIVHAIKNPAEAVAAAGLAERTALEARLTVKIADLCHDMEQEQRETETFRRDHRATLKEWDERMRATETVAIVAAQDAKYLKNGVDDLRKLIEKSTEEQLKHNERILSALVRIAGGRRGMPPISDEHDG